MKRCFLVLYLCLVRACLGIIHNASDPLDVRITYQDTFDVKTQSTQSCNDQLHASLEQIRRRQGTSRTSAYLDLSGYALHQPMRTLPVDMYVTDIKVRTPGQNNWVRVRRCQASRRGEITTHLEFSDLIVSGLVKMIPTAVPLSAPCRMTVRLRRAGLDLKAAAGADRSAGVQLRTESTFVEPNFLSVHAYGCWQAGVASREENTGQHEEESEGRSNDTPMVRVISASNVPEQSVEQRILPDKLAEVLKVKQQFSEQANAVFQAHGPFSQHSTQQPHPLQPFPGSFSQFSTPLPPPVQPYPFFTPKPPSLIQEAPLGQGDVTAEMEDIFLRGTKALLAKYLEKHLEVPLKETLMRQIGYTVSYG